MCVHSFKTSNDIRKHDGYIHKEEEKEEEGKFYSGEIVDMSYCEWMR